MNSLARFKSDINNIDNIRSAFDEEGYVILENVLNSSEISTLHFELEPYFEGRANCQALFFGFNTKRIEGLFKKSTVCQRMALDQVVLALTGHILSPNCDQFQINLTQGIRINPQEKAQILHPDSALFPIQNKPFEFQVNALWAYSDFTDHNGATRIVPKSHRWSEDRQPQPSEILAAEMPAGSVLVYQASLLHGGGANITHDQTRTGVAISYCLGWLRQSENQYLTYPPEIAKHFSTSLQELIGYTVHRPNLGWVNGQNPIYMLSDENIEHKGAEDFLTDEQKDYLMKNHYGTHESSALTSHNL